MNISENIFINELNTYIKNENEIIRLTEEYKNKYGLFNLINVLKKNKFNLFYYGSNNLTNYINFNTNMVDYEIELFAKIETFLKNNDDETMMFYLKEYEEKYGYEELLNTLLKLDEFNIDYSSSDAILEYIGDRIEFIDKRWR